MKHHNTKTQRRTMALGAALLALLLGSLTAQQRPGVNYDESKVPKYSLPDPLVMVNGERVTSAEAWHKRRRLELLRLFETHVYGRSPGRPKAMAFALTSLDRKALGGKASSCPRSGCATIPPRAT